MPDILKNLRQQLADCVAKNNIPGASLAIYHEGRTHTAAAGVLNLNTGVQATIDSVFMIGSTTKVLTSTLLMQLVDEGMVGLELPANRYLPEVKIGGEALPEIITVGMLLNHTSGIDGDFFVDTGWNEDAIEKYMERLTEVGYLHPPGRMRSYCNAAYSMVGRIIEKQRGEDFNTVLRKRLLDPAGIKDAVLVPEEFLKYRSAMGHEKDQENGGWKLSQELISQRGQIPAGTAVSMSATSLLELGRLHMNNGLNAHGERLLSESGVAEMQRPLTGVVPDLPDCQVWALYKGSGLSLYSHYGGTAGQNAWLAILPERDFAVAVLTNSQTGAFLVNLDLTDRLLKEVAGFEVDHGDSGVEKANTDSRPERFAGKFERYAMDIEICNRGDCLTIAVDDHEEELLLGNAPCYTLRPAGTDRFIIEGQELIPGDLAIEFFFEQDGVTQTLVFFGRAHRRVQEN